MEDFDHIGCDHEDWFGFSDEHWTIETVSLTQVVMHRRSQLPAEPTKPAFARTWFVRRWN